VQAIKKRSADLAADAEAFVNHVKDRGDRSARRASVVREAGTENMRQVAAKDLPQGLMARSISMRSCSGAGGNASVKSGEAPQFIVFASLSMPPQSLKPLIRDTRRWRWRRRGVPWLSEQQHEGVCDSGSGRSSSARTSSPISASIRVYSVLQCAGGPDLCGRVVRFRPVRRLFLPDQGAALMTA
jgi:hypothetical protein